MGMRAILEHQKKAYMALSMTMQPVFVQCTLGENYNLSLG